MGRRELVAVLSVAALLVASCGFADGNKDDVATGPTTTSDRTSAGNQVDAVIDGVKIQATLAPEDDGRDLTITPADVESSQADALVVAASPVSIELDGGSAQPSAPIRVQFDLSERPDVVAEMTDTVVPVVESVSATTGERDMFATTWDPATKTVTTEVTHLSNFWVSLFNVFKAIEDGIGRTFEELRGNTRSPCRERSELTLDSTDYVLTAVSPGAVAGCLADDNGAVAIDFDNATGAFYAILVAPDDIGGNWVVGQALNMGDAAGSIAAGWTPGSKGVLAGRSSGRLTLNRGVTQGDVRLTPQPQGILAKSLLTGISMFGVDLKRFEGIPQAWDCFATAVNAPGIDGNVSTAQLNGMIGDISQCVIALAKAQGGDQARMTALHQLSVVVALLIELPQQLWDFIATGLQQAARDSVKDFRLRSTADTSPAPGPAEPEPAGEASAMIDRVEVTTWAYDRVEGDRYVADNAGGKNLEVFWKSFAGADQVRSGCTSSVRISGPGASETKNSSGCDSYNPGTYLKIKSPGTYTVTVTVRQDGRPDITAERTVTVLPHR
ncbi:hypothetical protein [Mycolicibacterium sp. XJ1819]